MKNKTLKKEKKTRIHVILHPINTIMQRKKAEKKQQISSQCTKII